jgi:lysophospholipid acyltransferase (LPLAT)-like uncharacterized protein
MKKRLWLIAIRSVLWRIALAWCKTLKITIVNGERFKELQQSGKNYVVAFWHGSMFIGWFQHRPKKSRTVSALVSQSNDGEYLSTILERWKYTMIRGSSHIGGKESMQLMVDEVLKGNSITITPDGPRGPRREMKMGAVRLAQKTNVPLILAGIAVKNKKFLRSWDMFEIPMPFTSVVVKYSEPVSIPEELTGDALDVFKLTMQTRLNSLSEEAEMILGSKGAKE